jgi:tRNA-Thr(GGU) m(6)t(6)A37 methyltransferase TsaA
VSELTVRPIGRVESILTETASAPKQADEGAPPAVLRLEPAVAAGTAGLAVGDRIVVVTWLDRADRGVLSVHPRGDAARPVTGVFATRSPSRPNPLGLHEVTITSLDGETVGVDALEAVDGTPVLDIKPVLGADTAR